MEEGGNMSALRALSIVPLLLATLACAQESPCPIPQSPRNVNTNREKGVEYNFVSTKPLITDAKEPETIKFRGQTLYRCDQHYHVPVENTQGCANEQNGKPPEHGVPPPDQWIEVHTVYAAGVSDEEKCKDRLDHNLECCTKPPFVVSGFSAKVAGDGQPSHKPITPPTGTLFAEWSGSNTGPDKPNEGGCKPIAAQWSFLMGCEFKVAQSQLEVFHEAHGSRPVQSCNRISNDLALVGPDVSELDKKTCRWFDAGLIQNNAEANNKCSWTCFTRSPLSRWSGKWQTTKPGEMSQCSCCPALRPDLSQSGYEQ